ncbi:hypothetical protein DM02DRAFT_614240 [Periconia macrospinosa]|uniref:Rhodopsin domain-containing protein n=1 Tax=Periconia macrospinosa TaxID=97972 RepID=A0A2V1DRI1_9PLEO|nr:hypothetical protein DM02DRAFT_614240 [Periconia macrospinosa]
MATLSSPAAFAASSDNRFAPFTPEDHSAPIWIASILSLIFAYTILLVRLGFVKWNMHGLDDLLLTLGHLVGLGMWASLFGSLNNGLGKVLHPLSEHELFHMSKSFAASRILLFIALTFSKLSTIVFIQSIFDYIKDILLVSNVMIGIVTAWGLAAALSVSIGCSPDHILVEENLRCINDVTRLKAITIVDATSEIAMIFLPVVPLLRLQMPRKTKFLVMLAFSTRIPNVIFSILHFETYSDFIHHGDRGVAIATPVVWQNALLSYNFISATIPALKGFMRGFTTGGMGYTAGTISTLQGSGGNNSYNMRPVPKAKPKVPLVPEGYPESATRVTSVPLAPKNSSSRARGRSTKGPSDDNRETRSIASHDSQKILIQRDWEISRG